MDKIKNITDMHLFADSLLYAMPHKELPANVMISVYLSSQDYAEFFKEFRDLPLIYQHESLATKKGQTTYQYMGVKFEIVLDVRLTVYK